MINTAPLLKWPAPIAQPAARRYAVTHRHRSGCIELPSGELVNLPLQRPHNSKARRRLWHWLLGKWGE